MVRTVRDPLLLLLLLLLQRREANVSAVRIPLRSPPNSRQNVSGNAPVCLARWSSSDDGESEDENGEEEGDDLPATAFIYGLFHRAALGIDSATDWLAGRF